MLHSSYKRLNIRANFSWTFLGNIIYAFCQWANLAALAKLTTVKDVGSFALATAICIPIMSFTSLQLRIVQVTDAKSEYQFGHYFALRILTIIFALLCIFGVCIFNKYDISMAFLVILVALNYSGTAIREVFQAFLQKSERMDYMATGLIGTGILTVIILSISVWFTRNLHIGVGAMLIARLAVILLWDVRIVRKLKLFDNSPYRLQPIWHWKILRNLTIIALPMGITSAFIALNRSVCSFLIEAFMNREAVGYFAAIVSIPWAGAPIIRSLAAAASPRLARYYVTNHVAFRKLLAKLLVFVTSIGIFGFIITLFFGNYILSILFTSEYAIYTNVLCWLMAYGAISYLVAFLGYGITAARKFWTLMITTLLSFFTTAIIAYFFIPSFGLKGAAWALCLGSLTQGVSLAIMLTTNFGNFNLRNGETIDGMPHKNR